MKIYKITVSKNNGSLLNQGTKEVTVYNALDDKPKINIIVMPNKSGKSLIFNSLEHLISGNTEKFIKDTDRELRVEIEFSINEQHLVYIGTHGDANRIAKNQANFPDLEYLLRLEMGLEQGRLEYFGTNKNSLHSISRYYFFDFFGINEDESTNKIAFIDSRFDGQSKRCLLAYVLGAKINNGYFKTITEIEYKQAFIDKYKNKFENIEQGEQQSLEINTNINNLFLELEETRVALGDISVAISELNNLVNRYVKIYGNHTEDFRFLSSQLYILKNEKTNIESKIKCTTEDIRSSQLIENSILGKKGQRGKKDDSQLLQEYLQFRRDLMVIDHLAIDKYISGYIDPIITEFKAFLGDLYDIFVDNAIQEGILNPDDLMSRDNIIFDEKSMEIEAHFTTSEGTRKAIRLITFMGMQLFFRNKLHNSFYDSCLENIDSRHRSVLFNSFYEFLELKQLQLPNMFIFVTQIETMQDKDGLFPLKQNYKKYLNIHYSKGLHELN